MNVVEKLEDISRNDPIKPMSEIAKDINQMTVEKLWNDVIHNVSIFYNPNVVLAWHKVLMDYVKLDEAVFPIRCGTLEKKSVGV